MFFLVIIWFFVSMRQLKSKVHCIVDISVNKGRSRIVILINGEIMEMKSSRFFDSQGFRIVIREPGFLHEIKRYFIRLKCFKILRNVCGKFWKFEIKIIRRMIDTYLECWTPTQGTNEGGVECTKINEGIGCEVEVRNQWCHEVQIC